MLSQLSEQTESDLQGETKRQVAARSKNLKISLISLHGLIRGREPELGRDADTGGQIKYVL
ncbi:MAG: hypothetical protein AAF961_09815, partial [Planctomycetota bacterium]